jgi:glutathione S-transferase
MITLYTFGPISGLPDASPFVVKAMLLLKFAGLAYAENANGFGKAPKGKLPYIVDDGVTIADSTFIRFHIEAKYGFDFDAGLTPAERATAWAVEKMCDEHLYFALVDMRWCDDGNFEIGVGHFFDGAPGLLRPIVKKLVRRKVARAQKTQGTGRHTQAEIARLAICDIQALSDLIRDKPFLMGDRPCASDAAVFGVLSAALAPGYESPICSAARGRSNLVSYCERVMNLYFAAPAA